MSFPEVPQCTSQVGRPDDGTDTTGFFNTEYFVDLRPKEEWRPIFHEDKDRLIAAMQRELDKIPGVVWGFSQPIEDNMEEAVSGVKGELATKIYGDDLKTLEAEADEIVAIMRQVPGIEDLGVFRLLGQPNLNVTIDRDAAARYQINVADVQDAFKPRSAATRSRKCFKAKRDMTSSCAISPSIGTPRKQSKEFDCYLPQENVFLSRSFVKFRWLTVVRRSIERAISAI